MMKCSVEQRNMIYAHTQLPYFTFNTMKLPAIWIEAVTKVVAM